MPIGAPKDSVYPPEWTDELKEQIRERDGNICQICALEWPNDSERFSVHHIDGNKANCADDNLVTICKGCHTHVHFTPHIATYWMLYLQDLMFKNQGSIPIEV